MSLEQFSQEEHERLADAENRYGRHFTNARDASILLSNIVMWPVVPCDLFLRFLSQMKKHHTLSLISTVRLHRIQAKMILRYFLESTVHAAYTLAHIDSPNYFDYENFQIRDFQKAAKIAYKWIADHYPVHSDRIRSIKDQINSQTAHSNVIASEHNFRYVPGERPEIHTSFFDYEDEDFIKADLFQCAQVGFMAIDLILAVQKVHGGFIPNRDTEVLLELIQEHESIGDELDAARKPGP